MNIWIINHNAVPPRYGSQSRHYYFSKILSARGNNVKIFASSAIHNSSLNLIDNNNLYEEKIVDFVPYTFINTRNYRGNGISRIYNLIEFPIKLWFVCKKFVKPDIIYTSSPNLLAAFSALLWAKKNHIKCLLEVRDLWPESIVEYTKWSKKNLIIRILYIIEKWMYQTADSLIFTMEGGKQYIVDKGWDKQIDLKKVYHINNGVDIKEFDYNAENYQVNDPNICIDSDFKIIYAGAVRRANDVQQILECAKLLENKKDIKFYIYGTGNELENLKHYCQIHQINNVIFKGWIDKKYIPYILNQSSLNLINYLPTTMFRYGGSQNKLFEYLASGTPILSNISQKFCLVNKYKCGISKTITSPQEYAECIIHFYELDKKEYQTLCINARNAALKYDYNILANQLEIILKKTQGECHETGDANQNKK